MREKMEKDVDMVSFLEAFLYAVVRKFNLSILYPSDIVSPIINLFIPVNPAILSFIQIDIQ